MKTETKIVPDSLLMAIILHIYLGWGLLYLLKIATVHLSHNAYMGLIPAAIVIWGFLWLVWDLARLFPRQGICEIYRLVFGKIVGTMIGIFFMFYNLSFATIALRDAQLMVYSYFLGRTPLLLFTAVLAAIILYLALKGIDSQGRLAAFMLFPPLLVILFLILLGLANVDLNNVRPVLEGAPLNWLQAANDSLLILLPGVAIIFYLPFLKQPQSVKKIGFISLVIIVPLFSLALLGTVGVFGPALLPKMSWPIVEFFHIIDYPYLLLEQAGLFFLIAWYPFVFNAVTHGLFVVSNELHSIFPKIKSSWFIWALALILFGGANLPLNVIFLQAVLLRLQSLIPISFLAIILFTWLVARFRFSRKPS